MCEPATIIAGVMAVVGATTAAVSANAQKKGAENQMKAAAEAEALDQKALNLQMGEENDVVRLQQFERLRQGTREQSALAVALGEANMTGNTPMMDLSNVIAQTDYDMSIMESNREKTESQYGLSQLKVSSTAKGRINQAKSTAGTGFSNALGVVAGGAKGAQTGYTLGKTVEGMMPAPKSGLTGLAANKNMHYGGR